MPASLTRNEYYWMDDRLVQEVGVRASIYGKWRLQRARNTLVATIEDRGDGKKIQHGPAATAFRIAHAMLREQRLQADPNVRDIGVDIPSALVEQAADRINQTIEAITEQFGRLSNEERRTGALQFDINRYGVIEHDGWQLTIILQGFAANPKEKLTGADIGIVVDLKNGDRQVSKGLWIQAKQAEVMPRNPMKLQDMEHQMGKMLERTDDAYGLVYTPDGVFVQRGNDRTIRSTSSVIGGVASCRFGDRNPEFLADSLHRDYLIEMAFESLVPRDEELVIFGQN